MRQRPYVVINVAATADGKIDTFERHGAAISSERDRQRVDLLRASVDGVMVGSRTLHDEDPRLIVRSPQLRAERQARGKSENPAKVGIASRVALRPESRFLTVGPARIIVFTTAEVSEVDVGPLRARGVEVFREGNGRVDMVAAMRRLVELGLERVLVEGGGSLNFELLRLGLVDEVHVYIAPLVVGGATAPTLADGAGLPRDCAVGLARVSVDAWDDGGVLLRYMVDQS
jgi:2,5-diamino-6-(ribosylamino)-4(3H)-pyrimidinone 5'-phosphate reductase